MQCEVLALAFLSLCIDANAVKLRVCYFEMRSRAYSNRHFISYDYEHNTLAKQPKLPKQPRPKPKPKLPKLIYTEHCSVWSYQFYRDYYRHYYADEKVSADEKERFLNLDF